MKKEKRWCVLIIAALMLCLASCKQETVCAHNYMSKMIVEADCAGLGEIFDIVVEDMDRQSRELKG